MAGSPNPLSPMLATAGPLPRGEGWAYEVKWDGVRAVAFLSGDGLRLVVRSGTDHSGRYPELTRAPPAIGGRDVVIDGEIVAMDETGRPSFQLLQRRMHVTDPSASAQLARSVPAAFMAFDVLRLDGTELLERPYDERREVLEGLPFAGSGIHVPAAQRSDPESLVAFCRQRGLEGVVAKRRTSIYRPGRRTADWVKHKLVKEEDLLVIGWSPGLNARAPSFGALLLGYRTSPGGPVHFGGKVGSGFSDRELDRWRELLRRHAVDRPPERVALQGVARRDARWVEPILVVRVRFTEWTAGGHVRQASYRGQRSDVDPASVVLDVTARELGVSG